MNAPRPLSLLCEVTYRCNLQCPYCYNPLDYDTYRDELNTDEWKRVIGEAAELGVVQVHLSGGEPTLRRDLPDMARHASALRMYVNLITQGTFLDESTLDALIDAGVAHVQISIQAPQTRLADTIAGTHVHQRKLEALERVLRRDVAVTINCVLHRLNHDAIEDVIAFAERYGIRRLELANVQFYGWAYRNRLALMPTRAQVEHGMRVVAEARRRLGDRMQITYVLPDYFEEYPKPCMLGWGNAFITVAPNGLALPCPAAAAITTLPRANVRDTPLRAIWEDSPLFNAYRGTAWMPEPCRTCDRREIDFGGCRCQAFLLTGDAGVTDPACRLSTDHGLVVAWREDRDARPFAPRIVEKAR